MDISFFYSLPRAELLRYIQDMLGVMTEEQQSQCFAKELGKLSKQSSRSLLDWSTVPLRHIAIQVCYNGSEYAGLSQQPNKEYTVEELVLNAIKDAALIPPTATMQDVHFERSGRTDKGVSAAGQVFSLYIRTNNKELPPAQILDPDPHFYRDRRDGLVPPTNTANADAIAVVATNEVNDGSAQEQCEPEIKHVQPSAEIDYIAAINSRLPETIRVLGWSPVDANFSARHSASHRRYVYMFGQAGYLNIQRMADACKKLVGFHDFRNICKPAVDNVKTFERVIFSCGLEINSVPYEHICMDRPIDPESQLSLVVCGSAFLYHQIRCIASLLLHVGAELEPPHIITELLNVQKFPGKPDYPTAPGELLIFDSAGYTPTRLPGFYVSDRSFQFLTKHIRFIRAKAMTQVQLYTAALRLLEENRGSGSTMTLAAPLASSVVEPEKIPKSPVVLRPCDHPLVGITLTHKITDVCETYIEDGLFMTRMAKYSRILSRPFDKTLDKRLEERQKEIAAYRELHKETK